MGTLAKITDYWKRLRVGVPEEAEPVAVVPRVAVQQWVVREAQMRACNKRDLLPPLARVLEELDRGGWTVVHLLTEPPSRAYPHGRIGVVASRTEV